MQNVTGYVHESSDSMPQDSHSVQQNSWWILYLPLYFISVCPLCTALCCLPVLYGSLSLPSVNTVLAPGLWEFIWEHLKNTAKLFQGIGRGGQINCMQVHLELSACMCTEGELVITRVGGWTRWREMIEYFGRGGLDGRLTMSIVEVGSKCTST